MKRGLTLIEVLTVLVILSMVTSMAATGLLRQSAGAQLQVALTDVAELDALARLTAPSLGPIALLHDAHELELRTRTSDELISRRVLAADLILRDTRSQGAITTLPFDSRGVSDDYLIEVRLGPSRMRMTVCGLTGWIVHERLEHS